MGKDEKTSSRVATIAARVLHKGKASPKEAKTLAASVLTQGPDKPKPKKRGK